MRIHEGVEKQLQGKNRSDVELGINCVLGTVAPPKTFPVVIVDCRTCRSLHYLSSSCRTDPWKSIDEMQSVNCGVTDADVELAVAKAVKAVRRNRGG